MEVTEDRSDRYCIVGAGSSGLTVLKNFRQSGIACDCIEREDDVGGNWYYGRPASSVYASTHLISSKRLTEYTDFPMPADYPEFPSHRQAWDYLRNYARHFRLYEAIEFGTGVERIEPEGDVWQVALSGGNGRTETRRYRGIVIANGHNWDPKWPGLEGNFDGKLIHSADYKTPDLLTGKRVLVIGAGNSGCDIAVESALHADKTFQSMRRGYHYLPKFIRGKPVDQCGERLLRARLPLWARRFISQLSVRFAVGKPQSYGLPEPDHRLFETHPIINSQMLYYVGHGRITPKPDVQRLCGSSAEFVDGSREAIDVIICATGFRITFPFIDAAHLNVRDGRPELFLNIFHPRHDHLFVAGLIQPDSGQWGLVDYQAQLISRFIQAARAGDPRADTFRRLKRHAPSNLSGGIQYLDSTRHLLEVEHFSYRNRLKKLIGSLG